MEETRCHRDAPHINKPRKDSRCLRGFFLFMYLIILPSRNHFFFFQLVRHIASRGMCSIKNGNQQIEEEQSPTSNEQLKLINVRKVTL